MINIVIINGSPRKNGATAKTLHIMEDILLQKDNVAVEFVNISDLRMSPCIGCCTCYKTGQCIMNDDAEKLSKRIEVADGIIIGSPTYASNVSGQLKQYIDRGHFVIEQLLYNKYAISVATGENYGSKNTSKVINKLLKYSGAKLSGMLVYNISFNSNPGDNKKLDSKSKFLADKLYRDIMQQRRFLFQQLIHRVILLVGIKPFVYKKAEQYIGVVTKWRSKGIIK